MTNYSEILVYFFILPVVMQILLPLLMLVGFSIVSAGKSLLRLFNSSANLKNSAKVEKELQLSKA